MHLSIGSNQDDFVSLYCRKGSVDYDPVVELAAVGVSWGHVNSVKFTSEGKLIVNPQYTRTLLFASYYSASCQTQTDYMRSEELFTSSMVSVHEGSVCFSISGS
ncbi:hypothetical protein ABKN59_007455 [Abortiporus biennis]